MSELYSNNRSIVIKSIFIGVLSIIFLRILFLQIFQNEYLDVAENQAIKTVIDHPARGILYDRNGLPILFNEIRYDLRIEPRELLKKHFDTLAFCQAISMDTATFSLKLKKMISKNGYHVASPLLKELSIQEIIPFQAQIEDFPGVTLVELPVRINKYNLGGIVVGYISEISKAKLESGKYEDYNLGDYIGTTGLESYYEDELSGQRGVKYVLKNNKGKIIGPYKGGRQDIEPIAGKDLELSLDIGLQELAEQMMANKLGSVVAINPTDGGILAFVSAPSYKPNDLLGSNRSENFNTIYSDITKPMYNRAIQAQYSPGSTFKPISALIGLDMKVIDPGYGYPCHGGYYSCGRRIGCTHSGGGHAANLRLALAHSCNSYFCHVFRLSVDAPQWNGAVAVGQNKWYDYMTSFGFGRATGLDLPGENGGNVPNAAYFDKKYHGLNWNSCAGVMMGMGQGDLLVTPLQMANAMCIIANRGFYYTPHFVKKIGGDSTHAKIKNYLVKHQVAHIDDTAFATVGLGMMDVVTHGTGKIARIPDIEVCGKTGTVENYTLIDGKKVKLPNHSFFVAFAPRINPKIAVAVIVENSGYGATWAGPVASLLIEKYLTEDIAPKRKYLVDRMKNARIIPSALAKMNEEQIKRDIWYQAKKDSINRAKQLEYLELIKKIYTQK